MESNKENSQLTQDQIDLCISILEILNQDTDRIFEIPKDKRIELQKPENLLYGTK